MINTVNNNKVLFFLLILFVSVCYIILKRDELSAMDFGKQYSKIKTTYFGSESVKNVTDSPTTVMVSDNLQTSNNASRPIEVNAGGIVDGRRLFVRLRDIRQSTGNVFFIESRCATEKLSKSVNSSNISLNPRQSCAVESTAVTNPNRDIYVLHTCPVVDDDFLLRSPEYVRRLLGYPNVRIVTYNISEMFSNTPVEGLVSRRGLEESSFPVEHASDVLRLTMLWKYGGTYCDMDVITIRSLDGLKTNFCGLESGNTIGNAVLNFEPEGLGHDLLTRALQHINDHFDGSRWTVNGPDLVTRLVLQSCNATFVNLTNCTKFTVFNHTILYPVYWWDHAQLFDENRGPALVDSVKETAYIVHIWNKQSHSKNVTVGSTQAYGLLADEFCPSVYRNCGDSF